MALRHETTIEVDLLDDVELASRAAAGQPEAFEVLYRRYSDSAWRMAQAVTADPEDSADAVSEAFANLLAALTAGRMPPDVPFRPYLLVATRNAAIDQHRRRARVEPIGDRSFERTAVDPTPGEHLDASEDANLLCVAFRSLPERWRSVLWMTEVEGIPAREVGALIGLTPNSAAQLARRAREGLRNRFLQAHVGAVSDPECALVASQLGAYTAGGLAARARSGIEAHLARCPACRDRAEELSDVGKELRGIPLPIPAFLGFATYEAVRRRFPHEVAHSLAWAERATRTVAVGTAVLLALGLTTAGIMSGGGGVTAVPGSRSGGAVAVAPATNVSPLPDDSQGNVTGSSPGRGVFAAAPRSPSVDVAKGITPPIPPAPASPPAGPGKHQTTPPSPTPPPPSGLGLTLSANLGVATASASVLSGGCTSVSLNGSTSCAPKAPASPGLTLTLTTPLGTISAGPDVPGLLNLNLG